jgi:hypothetical protein
MTYKVQIDDEVRDSTADEAARIEQAHAAAEAAEQAAADAAAAAASGRTKLAALGLTDDEINALLGV